jgi:CPA2 family monovalent cation:H+ antiporter-2
MLNDLAIVTLVAALVGMLMRRLGQPSILGYLLAGLIVGPYIPIPLFADPHRIEELAEVGVVLVMFAVGLEFRIKRLLEVLPVSGLTAGIQIGALSWAGFTVGSVLGWDTTASVCLGATMAISSTMVVSAVLRNRPVDPDVRSHVFGILVVQDVVAIVLLALVTTLALGETVSTQSVALMIAQLAGAVVVMLIGGLLVLPRLIRFALAQSDSESLVVLVAGAAFGLAMVADLSGYSVALGAFICGIAVAESGKGQEVEHAIEPLRALFSAIFFVSIGMSVDPAVAWRSLPLAGLLCVVVIGMQLVSVTLGTVLTGHSLRKGIYAGLALGQVGELSFILATVAIGGGVLPPETLPALVTVATVTAFTTPQFLSRGLTLIDAADRWLPDWAQRLLVNYQAFVRRTRTATEGPSLQPPLVALLLEWLALVVLFVTHQTILPHIPESYVLGVDVATVLLAVPFCIGLVRSGFRLARVVRLRARHISGVAGRTTPVEALVLVAVVLGVGLPTLALLRPFVQGPWVETVFLTAVLAAFVVLGLVLRRTPLTHTSGVLLVAQNIARHVQDAETEPVVAESMPFVDTDPLADLDVEMWEVAAGAATVGKTLAELDLRCRSGATVVAIGRPGQTVTLPTGHEALQQGDVVALSGSPDAVARAKSLLMDGGPV